MNPQFINATLTALSTVAQNQDKIALTLTIQHEIGKLYKKHNPLADPQIFAPPPALIQ